MVTEAPQPWEWEGQTTHGWEDAEDEGEDRPQGLQKVPSLATDNSGTAKNAVFDGSTIAAAGRDFITVDAAAGLNQALVSQCSLVILRDKSRTTSLHFRTITYTLQDHQLYTLEPPVVHFRNTSCTL